MREGNGCQGVYTKKKLGYGLLPAGVDEEEAGLRVGAWCIWLLFHKIGPFLLLWLKWHEGHQGGGCRGEDGHCWDSVDGEGLLKKVKNIQYIPEQPDWTTYKDPTPASPPPSVDEYSPGNTQSVPSVPSGGTSSSRGSKRKAPLIDVVDAHFSALRSSLDGFTHALTSSNVHLGVISNAAVEQVSTMKDRNEILRSQTEILRRTPNYTYTEADIYDMLSGMQISDETLLEQCYDFLCANPTCVKRLMGLPPHKRWNKLCKMYSGGN
ncbi:uncharacterized protein HKW66_Vig0161950 [Vigna angularis]|uniref:Uncharacterized protein n=1 Tax=Phaseolus angularis TaxID=3914 RepID=A0A8T0JI82_PHAAN|nr:uncharacterized protein HKW66_Vig0161950 [Vigna angularis]